MLRETGQVMRITGVSEPIDILVEISDPNRLSNAHPVYFHNANVFALPGMSFVMIALWYDTVNVWVSNHRNNRKAVSRDADITYYLTPRAALLYQVTAAA